VRIFLQLRSAAHWKRAKSPHVKFVFDSKPHRNILFIQKPFHVADSAGAEMENARGGAGGWNFHFLQSFSVGVNGRPRSPLNSFFNRRSLELVLRRMISGATRLPISRR